MEQQPTSTDMFVESVRRLPAVDAAANAMWGSNVLLREDLERRRKQPKWDLRWLWVFPQLPVETLEGLAQAILVYKSRDVRSICHLNARVVLAEELTARTGCGTATGSPCLLSAG